MQRTITNKPQKLVGKERVVGLYPDLPFSIPRPVFSPGPFTLTTDLNGLEICSKTLKLDLAIEDQSRQETPKPFFSKRRQLSFRLKLDIGRHDPQGGRRQSVETAQNSQLTRFQSNSSAVDSNTIKRNTTLINYNKFKKEMESKSGNGHPNNNLWQQMNQMPKFQSSHPQQSLYTVSHTQNQAANIGSKSSHGTVRLKQQQPGGQ